MIVLGLLLLAAVIWAISKCGDFVEGVLDRVWSEKWVNKKTISRLKELYGNPEISDDAALTMAAKETHENESTVLAYFGARDAVQLAEMFGRRKMGIGTKIIMAFGRLGKTRR